MQSTYSPRLREALHSSPRQCSECEQPIDENGDCGCQPEEQISVIDLYDPRMYLPFEPKMEHYWAQGRDGRGRYTHGPQSAYRKGPDAYPPDSDYWWDRSESHHKSLHELIGQEKFEVYLDTVYVDNDTYKRFTWRTMADLASAAWAVAYSEPENIVAMAKAARNRLLKIIEENPVPVELFEAVA